MAALSPAAPDVDAAGTVPSSAQDTTRRTSTWLRARRGAGRTRRFGYAAYTVLLVLGSWYGVYMAGAIHRVRRERPLAAHADELAAVLPSGLVVAAAGILIVTAWDGLWRGPVTPSRPDVDWLLALPVRRGAVLLPWFALSAGVWVLAALLLGLVGALGIAAAGLGSVGVGFLGFVGFGVGVAVPAVVGALLVERSRRAAQALQRALPVLVLVLVGGAVQVVAAARGHRSRALEAAELWSGPWGWASQPVLAVAGGQVPLWPVALALSAVTVAAALVVAPRLVAGIPTAELRTRTQASTGVLAGIWALDLRAAKLSASGAASAARAGGVRRLGRAQRWAARSRAPRRGSLLILWRDGVGLVAAPRRLGLMAVLLAFSGMTAIAAVAASGAAAALLGITAALLGYFAAGAVLESARLDGDDVRRAAWLPRPFERVALEHALAPTLVMVVTGCLLALPVAVLAHPGAPLIVLAAAPVLVAAGLVGAYRPPAPVLLLAHPAFAEFGPLVAVLWYAAGPIVGVAGLTVLLDARWSVFGDAPATSPIRLAACWTLTAVMLWWTRVRAQSRR
ncbi:DUF6297 family protein [Streptodolium elevatio]